MSMLKAIQAVRLFQDKQWIPEQFKTLSYFSPNDLWHYFAISDDRRCELCDVNSDMDMTGDVLRGKFEYLEIIDENTIYPNVHPNCRCMLVRVAMPEEFTEEVGYAYPEYKGHE